MNKKTVCNKNKKKEKQNGHDLLLEIAAERDDIWMFLENTFIDRVGIDKILNTFQMAYKCNSSVFFLNKICRIVTGASLLS